MEPAQGSLTLWAKFKYFINEIQWDMHLIQIQQAEMCLTSQNSLVDSEERMTTKRLRAIFPLLKARIVDRDATSFKLSIGGSTTITVDCNMSMYDIRDGDLLTLYTEVLLKEPTNG